MAKDSSQQTYSLLFIHNNHIKNESATVILENGNQMNLITQDFISHLRLRTNIARLYPYQLGWVHKGGPCFLVNQRCDIAFVIIYFPDIVDYDVSPLNCVDYLLGIPCKH